ncbi:ATP-dependent helicase [Actinomycetospora sp. CA-101289]|uniref:ATP-dependent helicase n=1 Tax=Actinomycetospora sp. CA-101289 TaxID=3239893 RepID=UPI003D98F434
MSHPPSADRAPELRRAAAWVPGALVLDDAARRVVEHDAGFLRVLGGPGTGKTTLLAERVARLLHEQPGARPLVLVGDRRAAAALRERIAARRRALAGQDPGASAVGEPFVRSVHSYAFAVLRRHADRRGEAPPRLLPGAQQDAMVRELLAGEVAGVGAPSGWPLRMRPALEAPAFAGEVRDLLLRAAERGLGPRELTDLGKRHGVPAWLAAGRFYRTYEEVTLLRAAAGSANPLASAPPLDAAELVAAVLDAFVTDPELLEAERAAVRHLVVDDAHDMDPQQVELARALGAAADDWVLAGDPDSSVLGFRGADPALLRDADPGGLATVVLRADHRSRPAVRDAVARVVAALPGAGPGRTRSAPAGDDGPDGAATVDVFATAGRQAAAVADRLRRAHLQDGVPWSRMAVLVRSVSGSLPPLRRALLAAGVPLAVPADDTPLAALPAVAPLLTVLRCAADTTRLDADTALGLLASPLGGADPLAVRRLRRGLLRRHELGGGAAETPSDALIVDALLDHVREEPNPLAHLTPSEGAPLGRVGELLAAAAHAIRAGSSVPDVLWAVWERSGLQRRWVAASERGGVTGAQADRDLDAVVALVERAARYVEDLPGGTVAGFVAQADDQRIRADTLAPRAPDGEAVAVLTAHASRGREWDVVVVPDVQEGVWPDLRRRGTLLGVERLVDVLAGLPDDPAVAGQAPLLAEERRLFAVALSRARRAVHVSAVEAEDVTPSRFLDDVDGGAYLGAGDPADAQRPRSRPGRALVMAELVGELRRVVTDPDAGPERRERAADGLARLADAGVPGADPDAWYGLLAPSTTVPLRPPGTPVSVSPSAVETILTCPLRWALQTHGGDDGDSLASVTGSLVHALVQRAAEGADERELTDALDVAWASVDAGAPWFSRRELANTRRMLGSFLGWREQTRAHLTEAAVERELEVAVTEGVRVRGRVDRLEIDPHGRPVIIDVKTGKTPISKADAQEHPQLAVYQLATALGAFAETLAGPDATAARSTPGGARLVYLSRAGGVAKERAQAPLDDEGLAQWRDAVASAARATEGPGFVGRENDSCLRCPVRTACPVHVSGRQVP